MKEMIRGQSFEVFVFNTSLIEVIFNFCYVFIIKQYFFNCSNCVYVTNTLGMLLLALKRPGPGEDVKKKDRVKRDKVKAFQIIQIVLVSSVVTYAPMVIFAFSFGTNLVLGLPAHCYILWLSMKEMIRGQSLEVFVFNTSLIEALKRPGPGEDVKKKDRVNRDKVKAFQIIQIVLLSSVVTYAPMAIFVFTIGTNLVLGLPAHCYILWLSMTEMIRGQSFEVFVFNTSLIEALKRPGPGEDVKKKDRVNRDKVKAFQIIQIVLVSSVVTYVVFTIGTNLVLGLPAHCYILWLSMTEMIRGQSFEVFVFNTSLIEALKRPGPGEDVKKKDRVNRDKVKAFQIIQIVLVSSVVTYGPMAICLVSSSEPKPGGKYAMKYSACIAHLSWVLPTTPSLLKFDPHTHISVALHHHECNYRGARRVSLGRFKHTCSLQPTFICDSV
ncbi:unnamed protein product [Leuciscus chuanchicus]